MIRVRNEEEFLTAAVKSVVEHVDDAILVDNDSTDRTPQIIRALLAEYPDKIAAHRYPHSIRRVGTENWALAESSEAPTSPHLSANFYNWCLQRCMGSHVLKWDGDMIALPSFGAALDTWRNADQEIMMFRGANVHPDRRHLARARCADREKLLTELQVPGMPAWVTSLTYDALEPRLFPRRDATYTYSNRWTQKLQTPEVDDDRITRMDEPCFLHLKFCKPDPLSNYSEDLAAVIASNIDVGPALEPAWHGELQRWGAS